MNRLRNERGIALVTALLLTMLALAIVAAVLYIVTQGIQVSAASKKYKTALEATHGGLEVFTKDIITQIYTGTSTTQLVSSFPVATIGLSFFGSYTSCVKHKLNTPTSQWSTGASAVCGSNAKVINPKNNYDATFTLKGTTPGTNYKAYAQIVDTVTGNSCATVGDALLGNAAGTTQIGSGGGGSGSAVDPIHTPALFTIEVQGEKETNPLEKARLSVLYAY